MSTPIHQIVYRDPVKDLHPHALVKAMPRWAQDDPDFINFSDDIFTNGVKNPIKITKDNQVIDGETRRQAAKKRGLKEVPCIIIPDDEVHETILRELCLRRQLTKGALAYVAFPVILPTLEEIQARHIERLKTGNKTIVSSGYYGHKSVEDLSESIGVSRKLFYQAKEVHQAFAEDKSLRDQFELAILTGETGLGAVIAGIAGQKSTKGKSKPKEDQLDLFEEGLTTIQKRFRYWAKFDADDRDTAAKAIRKTVAEMPKDVRAEFARAIKAIEKEDKE